MPRAVVIIFRTFRKHLQRVTSCWLFCGLRSLRVNMGYVDQACAWKFLNVGSALT
jgi:hypothetical protein